MPRQGFHLLPGIFGGVINRGTQRFVLFAKNTVAIYNKDRHKLCNHVLREDELKCCEEFCMDRITVDEVFDTIKKHI